MHLLRAGLMVLAGLVLTHCSSTKTATLNIHNLGAARSRGLHIVVPIADQIAEKDRLEYPEALAVVRDALETEFLRARGVRVIGIPESEWGRKHSESQAIELGKRIGADVVVLFSVTRYYQGSFWGRYTSVGFKARAISVADHESLWMGERLKETTFNYDHDPRLLARQAASEFVTELTQLGYDQAQTTARPSQADESVSPPISPTSSPNRGVIDLTNLHSFLPNWVADNPTLAINDVTVQRDSSTSGSARIRFLGGRGSILRQGLNYISDGVQKIRFWIEQEKLEPYEDPYSDSYAILVAIDDYDRDKDPLNRSATGYPALTKMTEGADNLSLALMRRGFPATNIIRLYDQHANSQEIKDSLMLFWEGGKYANADRLVFYFGGHGSLPMNSSPNGGGVVPFLVTYDFDDSRPAATSLQFQELTVVHAANLNVHHVLFALDACHSGLALSTLGFSNIDDLQRFRTLSAIRAEVEPRARNLLVAGTGSEKALWHHGGVFTTALISGLEGEADLDGNGIIQLHELEGHVRMEVVGHAASTGVRQTPQLHILSKYGRGRVVF